MQCSAGGNSCTHMRPHFRPFSAVRSASGRLLANGSTSKPHLGQPPAAMATSSDLAAGGAGSASGAGGLGGIKQPSGTQAPSQGRLRESSQRLNSLCIIPEASLWPQIQHARCFNDTNFVRAPPHIELLHPAIEGGGDDAILECAEAVARACHSIQPFQIQLDTLLLKLDGPRTSAWLDPDCNQLRELQQTLVGAFPDWHHCHESMSNNGLRQATNGLMHLGNLRSRRAAQDLQQQWRPISTQIGTICLMSRQENSPFRIRYEVPLGGAGPPVQVDAPYVATAGPPFPEASPGGKYGLGSLGGGVNYFAFGANINPHKLIQARRIQPLESSPAVLPGYRLEFNHRGGFGNVVRLQPGEAGPKGLTAVHGVVHCLEPEDIAKLTNMEHEYWPMTVEAQLYESHGGSTVPCVAFVTPPERKVVSGLAPTGRYLNLLKDGAKSWPLDAKYCEWLDSLSSVHQDRRDIRYYESVADGSRLPPWPKSRADSQPKGKTSSKGSNNSRRRRPQNGATVKQMLLKGKPPTHRPQWVGSAQQKVDQPQQQPKQQQRPQQLKHQPQHPHQPTQQQQRQQHHQQRRQQLPRQQGQQHHQQAGGKVRPQPKEHTDTAMAQLQEQQ